MTAAFYIFLQAFAMILQAGDEEEAQDKKPNRLMQYPFPNTNTRSVQVYAFQP